MALNNIAAAVALAAQLDGAEAPAMSQAEMLHGLSQQVVTGQIKDVRSGLSGIQIAQATYGTGGGIQANIPIKKSGGVKYVPQTVTRIQYIPGKTIQQLVGFETVEEITYGDPVLTTTGYETVLTYIDKVTQEPVEVAVYGIDEAEVSRLEGELAEIRENIDRLTELSNSLKKTIEEIEEADEIIDFLDTLDFKQNENLETTKIISK